MNPRQYRFVIEALMGRVRDFVFGTTDDSDFPEKFFECERCGITIHPAYGCVLSHPHRPEVVCQKCCPWHE